MITLQTELKAIRGLGENFISKLEKLNIRKVRDLLWHFPYRYDDFSRIYKIADLTSNQIATVSGVVKKIDIRRTWKKKMLLVEVIVADDSGGIKAIWFNQPYIGKILKPGLRANFSGKVSARDGELYLASPTYEPLFGGTIKHTAGLIPVYQETKGLTSRGLRYLIKPILTVLPPTQEFIPKEILTDSNLPEINFAIKGIHFPRNLSEAEGARARFAFEDLFLLQIHNLKLRAALSKETAIPVPFDLELMKEILATLPFELTNSQKRSLYEILKDLSLERPMNRLLQGDVGSGKTVIAALAAIAAAHGGFQAAFMAPTEVLGRQHYSTIKTLFGTLLEKKNIRMDLLLGGVKTEKAEALKNIKAGKTHIVVGTHALIQKKVLFNGLALVVIDEQHRFGVEQRAALLRNHGNANERHKESTGPIPHFLSMSATPIPRTLTLTIFGDLELSIIDELPKGRRSIITKIVAPANRLAAYEFIRKEIKIGRQAFVICPRIEIGGQGPEVKNDAPTSNPQPPTSNAWSEVKAVKEEYEKLSKSVFPDLKVAMMHGKLKSAEKEKAMSDFKNGLTDILVSTSVIEVGVDIPNATIMVIEGAERFGLAQLYQFRGRIGRGEHQSYCLLFTDAKGENTGERLNALLKAKNGFELSELDLKIRGPGEFLGGRQTGLPDLAMKSLNNIALIKTAREAAQKTLAKDQDLQNSPLLKAKLTAFQQNIHLE